MTTERLDTLVWVCIYGGLASLMLGLWSSAGSAVLGPALAAGGGVLVLLGVVLVWLRSRRRSGGERDGKAGPP